MRNHIPNFITTLNLLSGCIALVFAFDGHLAMASLFIAAGAFFDFIDGFIARLLRVKSSIGKELDSLADVITFGLVPGVLVYQLMLLDLNAPGIYLSNYSLLAFFGFLIPVFSALRLAKFNTDPRQDEVFLGLPTPATAIFLGSFPLILMQKHIFQGVSITPIHEIITNIYVLVPVTVFLSWLMISEVALFSLKFRSFSWKENKVRFVFLGISAVLLFYLYFAAIPLIILLYVILSLLNKGRS